ncbi:MAG: 50S ribosomal protein L10 [Candidatus Muproteobacteria bacterium RBG_16_64_11]|uniref:Large ribosomal subunit protein uL10 n=1 Tax=Candidatus Muproteobacteria bacterium RBG_16_64_11 TaxID=1817758 RepID=A0A1F6TFE3_9PROT|nr:MAG: 50S ribosomal protein L10 [Candidatus Muproteobacteria bacterium RBG_16_64_11]
MSLNLEQKQAIVAEVSEVLAGAQAAIVAEYRGLTVAQMTALRRNARKSDIYVRVVKNTLVRRAVKGSQFEGLSDHLSGPLAFTAGKDPAALAKLLMEFSKDNEKFRITAGSMQGKLMSKAQMDALAKLPSREILLATLMGTMIAPVQKFAQTLNEVPARFVRTLAAVRDQKQAA